MLVLTRNGVSTVETDSKPDFLISDNDMALIVKYKQVQLKLLDSLETDRLLLDRVGIDQGESFEKDLGNFKVPSIKELLGEVTPNE